MLVYKVTNLANEKVYIGKTITTLGRRWTSHKWQAKAGGGCPYLGAAIRKHGSQSFIIEPLHTVATVEDLDHLEVQMIAFYHSNDPTRGYNLTVGGGGTTGFRQSEKQKRMMRERVGPMLGRHHSEEAKRKISEHTQGPNNHFFGKQHTLETRQRMGHIGQQHPNFGKHLPESTKQKIRVANAKTYLLQSPDGKTVRITGLKTFCKQNGFHYPKMCTAANGGPAYRGWGRGN